jgi:hypothetical protein
MLQYSSEPTAPALLYAVHHMLLMWRHVHCHVLLRWQPTVVHALLLVHAAALLAALSVSPAAAVAAAAVVAVAGCTSAPAAVLSTHVQPLAAQCKHTSSTVQVQQLLCTCAQLATTASNACRMYNSISIC